MQNQINSEELASRVFDGIGDGLETLMAMGKREFLEHGGNVIDYLDQMNGLGIAVSANALAQRSMADLLPEGSASDYLNEDFLHTQIQQREQELLDAFAKTLAEAYRAFLIKLKGTQA